VARGFIAQLAIEQGDLTGVRLFRYDPYDEPIDGLARDDQCNPRLAADGYALQRVGDSLADLIHEAEEAP